MNALNIGTGIRDLGSLAFNQTSSGVIKIRVANGTGRAAFNMGTGSATTAVALNGNQNTFDVTGHQADLLLGAVNIGTQNRGSDLTNVFSFDQGTLTMSTKAANAFTTTSTVNLGGGTVSIDNTASAVVTMATNAGPGISLATINVTGGDVLVKAFGGTSVTMATKSGTGGSSAAAINITGGVVTMEGAIAKGALTGTGTSTATVKLDGGELNMSTRAIGSSTAMVDFVVKSGTLRNLGQLNGGSSDLVKNGAGTLKLGGAINHTGATNIDGGTVEMLAGSSMSNSIITINNSSVLAGSGSMNTTTLVEGGIRPGEVSGNSIGKLFFENGLIVRAASAATPNSVVMQIRGATGLADLSSYTVGEIFESAGDLVSETVGDHDHINVMGELTWDPGSGGTQTTKIIVEDLGVSYQYGQVFNLFDWSGVMPDTFLLPTWLFAGGAGYDLVLPDFGSSGFLWDVSLFREYGAIVVVPEPGRMVLLIFGFAVLVLRRRRKA